MMFRMTTNESANPQPVFVDVFELRYLGAALRRHGWVVVLMGALGVLAGWGMSTVSPPVYRAEAVLLVNIQTLKIGLDGIPMDVEVMLPARRLVGTVCESDQAMAMLAGRLSEELTNKAGADEPKRVAWLRDHLYYDQRGLEMAALRAVASDPQEAADLANAWAGVSQSLLREAYGTTEEDVTAYELKVDEAMVTVYEAQQALDALPGDAADSTRHKHQHELGKAQQLRDSLQERWATSKIRLADTNEIAKIFSPASPPAESINPPAKLVMGLFGVAGLLLGLAVALLRGLALRK